MEAAASACPTMGRLISSIDHLRPRSVRVHALANDNVEQQQTGEAKKADRARRALEKAAAYRKKLLSKSSGEQSDVGYEISGDQKVKEVPQGPQAIGEEDGNVVQPGAAGQQDSGEFLQMERAQINTGAMASETGLQQVERIDESEDLQENRAPTGEILTTQAAQAYRPVDAVETSKDEKALPSGSDEIIVKIYTKEGVITKRTKPDPFGVTLRADGFGFSEKREPGQPASLNEGVTAPPRMLSEVGKGDSSEDQRGGDLYRPGVSTWGVFPRPANISKTFGGGRVIRPGEEYDRNPEEKQARELTMKQLVDDQRKRMGLDIPPEVTLVCQQFIDKADALVTAGRRTEALECLDIVLDKVVYESELHGEAALQKAICLDSMSRSSEARSMFKKLATHSKFEVRRSAKRLLYTYKAAEKLRFTGPVSLDTSEYYQKFFDRLFPDDYKRYKSYKPRKNEAEVVYEMNYDEVLLSMMIMLTPFTLIIGMILRRRLL